MPPDVCYALPPTYMTLGGLRLWSYECLWDSREWYLQGSSWWGCMLWQLREYSSMKSWISLRSYHRYSHWTSHMIWHNVISYVMGYTMKRVLRFREVVQCNVCEWLNPQVRRTTVNITLLNDQNVSKIWFDNSEVLYYARHGRCVIVLAHFGLITGLC
jgi:hypothetical protein